VETHDYVDQYLLDAQEIITRLDRKAVRRALDLLVKLKQRQGRLFILGVGGGAGHASHAVNDFRKIAGIEAYAPTDNVSELTARINDEGWENVFLRWLEGSRLGPQDAVLVFSVGGGSQDKQVSTNLIQALRLAQVRGARILGIVGRDGGFTAEVADAAIVIPTVNAATVTPHTESMQAVVWHLLVSHPDLKAHEMKWESLP
jgi:D-sedoheptulose 7-phosphate isomerase